MTRWNRRIKLLTSPCAPCCFILAREISPGKFAEPMDEANTVLSACDYEWPNIAREFGWNMAAPSCDHSGTDGSIDCPECGEPASEFISAAACWMHDNIGAVVDDPGYWD